MRVVLFGDSVFAGHGLARADGPAARLAATLEGIEVVAAGVVDETSRDGLRRVGAIEGDVVLVEFGLNDAIEGLPRATTIGNLKAIVASLGNAALLVEALAPAGSRWPPLTEQAGVVAAAANGEPFVPDILSGLGDVCGLQDDGLHPNAAGAAIVAGRLARFILERTKS